jgi:hypothetical protein
MFMLKNGVLFAAVQPEYGDVRYRERALRNLQRQARKLGAKLGIETDVQAA